MPFLRAALAVGFLMASLFAQQTTGVRLRAFLAPSYGVEPESIPLQVEIPAQNESDPIIEQTMLTHWNLEASSRRLQATVFFENPACALRSASGECVPASDLELGSVTDWTEFPRVHGLRLFVQPVSPASRVGRREDRLQVRLRPLSSAHPQGTYRGLLRVRLRVE